MVNKGYIIAIQWIVLLCVAQPSPAQTVSIQASVSETSIGTEEQITYNLEIKGVTFSDVTTPQPPETESLVLLSPVPSTQRNMTFINGELQQSVSFRWTYRPTREGDAQLGAMRVTVKGSTYETEAIRINVVSQDQRPRRQTPTRSLWPFGNPTQPAVPDDTENSRDISEENMFIRVITSAHRALQNEQITLEYQLFFRDGIQPRQSRLAGSWDAEGFWREEFDVESRPIPRSAIENGLRYNMIVLKRVAVFPTHPGSLQVDPLRIESEVYNPFRSTDPFDQFFSLRNQYNTIELASPAVNIEAVPFPGNTPLGFSGAVGIFRLDTQADRTEIEVGEPIQVTVTISGSGNIATLDAPSFTPPGVFEQYDPEVNTSINRATSIIQGRKTFTYVLVPRSNGTFEIPSITFAFYNPDAGRYTTLRSDPIPIHVSGTMDQALARGITASGLPVDDIAGPMISTGSWISTETVALYRKRWIYFTLVIPLILVGVIYAYHRHVVRITTDKEYARNRMAHPLARKHLKQADLLLKKNQPHLFYEEIERAILGFIGNRLNIAEHGQTREQLDIFLIDLGIGDGTRMELRRLLDECDQARFAPVLPDRTAMERARDQAAKLIIEVDEAASQQTSTTV